jgi:hypothetical protein
MKKYILKRQQFNTVEKVHSAAMTAFCKMCDLKLYTPDLQVVILCILTGVFTNMLPPLQMEAQVPTKCS